MKKHKSIIILSLALPFLVNCGNATKEPINHCTFTFNGENCTLQGEQNISLEVVQGDTISYTFVAKTGFLAPEVEDKPAGSTYETNNNVGIFTMKIDSDVTINASSMPDPAVDSYTFKFEGTNCLINGQPSCEEKGISITKKAKYVINAKSTDYGCPILKHVYKLGTTIEYNLNTDYTYVKSNSYGILEFKNETPEGIHVIAESEVAPPVQQHCVIWNYNNGKTDVEYYDDGATLNVPSTPPVKDKSEILSNGEQYGYTFTEWDWAGKEEDEDLPSTVDKDYVFNACYEQHSVVSCIYFYSIDANKKLTLNCKETPLIDWGDGNGIQTGSTGDNVHTYSSKISHAFVVRVYGDLTELNLFKDESGKAYQIDLSNTITIINDYAYDYTSIQTINIPSSVTRIGESAFKNCSKLTNINFADGSELTTIGDEAFRNCSTLKSLEIPSKVSTLGRCMFIGCNNMELKVDTKNATYSAKNNYILSKDGKTLVASCAKSGSIPSTVEIIGSYAYEQRGISGTFEIPNHIVSISEHAFDACKSITEIKFPAEGSLTSIGDYAFNGCESITGIEFPAEGSLTSIGDYAFNGCKKLDSHKIIVPGYLTNVGKKLFNGCTSMTYILCGGIPSEGWDSEWNSGLQIYTNIVHSGVDSSGYKFVIMQKPDNGLEGITFGYTGAGGALTIPGSFEYNGENIPNVEINKGAFINNSSITSVSFASATSLVTIGESAFEGCENIASVTLNNATSLKTIAKNAFSRAFSLKTIDLEKATSLETIGSNGFGSTDLETVTIPSSLKTLEDGVFDTCISLKTVNFPTNSNLETIGSSVFSQTMDLTTIKLPSSVKTIRDKAFEITHLKTVDLTNFVTKNIEAIPKIGKDIFHITIDFGFENIYVHDADMLEIFLSDTDGWAQYADYLKVPTI